MHVVSQEQIGAVTFLLGIFPVMTSSLKQSGKASPGMLFSVKKTGVKEARIKPTLTVLRAARAFPDFDARDDDRGRTLSCVCKAVLDFYHSTLT